MGKAADKTSQKSFHPAGCPIRGPGRPGHRRPERAIQGATEEPASAPASPRAPDNASKPGAPRSCAAITLKNSTREGRPEPSSHGSLQGAATGPRRSTRRRITIENPQAAGHGPEENPRRDEKNTRRESPRCNST
ncbi:MAG: hypothetical protein GX216_08690 [Methanomicrobiales archaeon]|nr:hypothetical protein [Methanomicrobiales archaeon]